MYNGETEVKEVHWLRINGKFVLDYTVEGSPLKGEDPIHGEKTRGYLKKNIKNSLVKRIGQH